VGLLAKDSVNADQSQPFDENGWRLQQ
jgi:hypothetical protein